MDKWEFTWVALIPLDQIQEVKDLGDQGWEPFAVTVDEIRGILSTFGATCVALAHLIPIYLQSGRAEGA
jgi:hypothetical protein